MEILFVEQSGTKRLQRKARLFSSWKMRLRKKIAQISILTHLQISKLFNRRR